MRQGAEQPDKGTLAKRWDLDLAKVLSCPLIVDFGMCRTWQSRPAGEAVLLFLEMWFTEVI